MISPTPQAVTVSQAEALALQAIAFIAADEANLTRFLSVTGFTLEILKAKLTEPATLLGVLQYILEYEPRLMAFCDNVGINPSVVVEAARRLAPHDDSPW